MSEPDGYIGVGMGELCKAWCDELAGTARRRSIPTCVDRTDVDISLSTVELSTTATNRTSKTRWSIGGSAVCGRGVPDIVRASRYDVQSGCCVEDGRKRSLNDQSADLPAKRISQVCGRDGAASSAWNCTGLTWNGLRRRLSLFRRSSRVLPRLRHSQPPDNTGKSGLCHCYEFCRHVSRSGFFLSLQTVRLLDI